MIHRLKRGYTKANLIYYDIETITVNDELKFRLGVVTAEGLSFVAYDAEIMTDIIISLCDKNKSNYIIAHNAQFDFSLLIHDKFDCCEMKAFSTQPFLIHYRLKDKHRNVTNFVFLDSMSFFKSSLDELGKVFGEEKQIIDVLRDRFDTEIAYYCVQDTKVLGKIMEFINEQAIKFDIRFPITFAQMSFNIFKRHYLKKKIVNPIIEEIMQLERESYFGGRVEAFNFEIHEKSKCFDINSLYPFVMEHNYFPVKIKKFFTQEVCLQHQTKIYDFVMKAIKNNKLIIAKVIVDIPECYIGPIPKRIDEKLIFPFGTFETVLCNPELELVKDNIIQVLEVSVYEKKRIFANFITDMYTSRLRYDSKHPLNLFYKLVMNSLYGKFAQRKFVFERKTMFDDILEFGKTDLRHEDSFINLDFFNGKAFHREIKDINPKSFVAISSFVTSYARRYLYEFLIKNQDNLIYCDTDSMFVNNVPVLVMNDKLGGWKEEYELTEFQVLGNKHYQSNEIRKIKGVPHFARVLDNYTFEFQKITKMRESIVRFGTPQPRLVMMKKIYNDEYTKRIVLPDLTTKALSIIEIHPSLISSF